MTASDPRGVTQENVLASHLQLHGTGKIIFQLHTELLNRISWLARRANNTAPGPEVPTNAKIT